MARGALSDTRLRPMESKFEASLHRTSLLRRLGIVYRCLQYASFIFLLFHCSYTRNIHRKSLRLSSDFASRQRNDSVEGLFQILVTLFGAMVFTILLGPWH